MIDVVAHTLFWTAAFYGAAGLVFAVVFHWRGIGIVDPVAAKSGRLFRLLITPGLVALWPAVARQWRSALVGQQPDTSGDGRTWPRRTRALHRHAIQTLCVLAPLVAGTGIAYRQPPILATAAVRDIPAFSAVAHDRVPLFSQLGVDARLFEEDSRFQIEVFVPTTLSRPAVALYWSANDAKGAVIAQSVFLGTVWGPAVHHFMLPVEYAPGKGSFQLYAALDAETVGAADDPFEAEM